MDKPPIPSEENDFLSQHVALLRDSLRHWTGLELIDPRMNAKEAARFLFHAPFAVASHDTAKDPLFNYANQTALGLFAMSWEEMLATPSRLSAEEVKQEERERVLREVSEKGFIEHYNGIRIGRHGRRFAIEDTVVWNLTGPRGEGHRGQAAWIRHWKFL